MLRNLALVVVYAVFNLLTTTAWAAEFGTAEEAKAMLEKAVAAVKENKAKALDMFNKGEVLLRQRLGRLPNGTSYDEG
jgi:predicted negative regulator of RcsB-dependent stress response